MKSKNNNVWFWFVISIYTVITILRLINHQPWFDEAHAYSIAQEMNLLEIIQLMSLEGHTFLWYLLLMPFARAYASRLAWVITIPRSFSVSVSPVNTDRSLISASSWEML